MCNRTSQTPLGYHTQTSAVPEMQRVAKKLMVSIKHGTGGLDRFVFRYLWVLYLFIIGGQISSVSLAYCLRSSSQKWWHNSSIPNQKLVVVQQFYVL